MLAKPHRCRLFLFEHSKTQPDFLSFHWPSLWKTDLDVKFFAHVGITRRCFALFEFLFVWEALCFR